MLNLNQVIKKKTIKNINLNITSKISDPTTIPLKEKLRKEDLDNSLELLTYSEKKLSDVNTTHDYILFSEGDGWVCVVDVLENVSFFI